MNMLNIIHYHYCSWYGIYPLLVFNLFAKMVMDNVAVVIVCVNIGVQYYSSLFHYGHTIRVMAVYHCTLQHISHLTLPATVAPSSKVTLWNVAAPRSPCVQTDLRKVPDGGSTMKL